MMTVPGERSARAQPAAAAQGAAQAGKRKNAALVTTPRGAETNSRRSY
jgi:hypothetical protein